MKSNNSIPTNGCLIAIRLYSSRLFGDRVKLFHQSSNGLTKLLCVSPNRNSDNTKLIDEKIKDHGKNYKIVRRFYK